MSKYILDTDVIIYHLRGTQQLNSEWISGGTAISIVTLGELLYGAKKSNKPKKSMRLITQFIDTFSLEILSLDETTMVEYAKQRSRLERKGRKLDNFDLLIGVTAKQHSKVLVTNNKRHFSRIDGLEIV